MKKIWKLLKNHIKDDFSWPLYLSIGLFLGISIAINYAINLENGIIDRYMGRSVRMLWYFLLYSFAYYGAALITFHFSKTNHHWKSRKFWIISLSGMIVLGVSVGWPYMMTMMKWFISDYNILVWAFSVGNNVISFFNVALPVLLLAKAIETRKENFGVNNINIDLNPYWQLLMVIVPIIIIASFEKGFHNYYPTYKQNMVAVKLGWPGWVPAMIYEFFYGIDFFNVELIFRGLLVVGVSQAIGKEAIMPMVSAYCFLHFGKPVGEAISSIFGGYILGVVAYQTRNLWGGVIVHMGLAWMMELAAWLQDLRVN